MQDTIEAFTVDLPACERGLEPDEVDRRLGAVARAHGDCETALAFWLLEVDRRRLYEGFGFRDTVQYAAERHGKVYGTTYRLLRAARACEQSPALRDAFGRGEVELSKVDVLAPVLHGDEADTRWVDRAKTESRRDLKSAVQRALGLEPDDERITLTVQLTPSQWRIFQDALERCRRIAGADIAEAEAIELLSAEFLNTPVEEHEVGASVEPTTDFTGAAAQPANTAALTPEEQAREARINAALRLLVMSHCAGAEGRGHSAPPVTDNPATDCTGAERGEAGEDCTGAEVATRDCTSAARAESSADCTGAETRAQDCTGAEIAASDAPDAELRRRVLDRDGWRCTIPGCGARTELQVDHILPRSRFPELRSEECNLTVVCAPCHRLKTLGLLHIERASNGVLAIARPDRWGNRPASGPSSA